MNDLVIEFKVDTAAWRSLGYQLAWIGFRLDRLPRRRLSLPVLTVALTLLVLLAEAI
jgi:hypothetical protein